MRYYLKYRDFDVVSFDAAAQEVEGLHKHFLPIQLQSVKHDFTMIRKFCSGRILMMNRKFCKDILTCYGVDDQTDLGICLACSGLSFRDCYWLCPEDSRTSWKNINLFDNEFSFDLSKTALTGIPSVPNDSVYTGELTGLGTRAKGFFRSGDKILLVKDESRDEINSEILTYYIARLLDLRCTKYENRIIFGKHCSVCALQTSVDAELIPCRDYMELYQEHRLSWQSETYRAFMKTGGVDFVKMQILDYLILNTDRNRDNYGMIRVNGSMAGMYPMFDHDSAFKGIGTNGIYFPSGMTFADTLSYLKQTEEYASIRGNLQDFVKSLESDKVKELFLALKSISVYQAVRERAKRLLD